VRGEFAAHPAFMDAVRAGGAVDIDQRALERGLEFVAGRQAEGPVPGSRCQSGFR